MKRRRIGILLLSLAVVGCAATQLEQPDPNPALLEAVLEDIRVGWEQGDGEPFYTHFLDWEGARYFEGGGENEGLQDLVENHVEPEAELGLRLGFSNIQTHFEGSFAWALVDTKIRLTTPDGMTSITVATERTSSDGWTARGRSSTPSRRALQ